MDRKWDNEAVQKVLKYVKRILIINGEIKRKNILLIIVETSYEKSSIN